MGPPFPHQQGQTCKFKSHSLPEVPCLQRKVSAKGVEEGGGEGNGNRPSLCVQLYLQHCAEVEDTFHVVAHGIILIRKEPALQKVRSGQEADGAPGAGNTRSGHEAGGDFSASRPQPRPVCWLEAPGQTVRGAGVPSLPAACRDRHPGPGNALVLAPA